MIDLMFAISGVKTISDTLKKLLDAKTFIEVNALLSDMNTKLIAAQEHISTLQGKLASRGEEISSLKNQIISLKKKSVKQSKYDREHKNYVMQAVVSEKIHFVQVYKPVVESGDQPHWACVKCFQKGKLSILSANERFSYECPKCHTEIKPLDRDGCLSKIDSAYK